MPSLMGDKLLSYKEYIDQWCKKTGRSLAQIEALNLAASRHPGQTAYQQYVDKWRFDNNTYVCQGCGDKEWEFYFCGKLNCEHGQRCTLYMYYLCDCCFFKHYASHQKETDLPYY